LTIGLNPELIGASFKLKEAIIAPEFSPTVSPNPKIFAEVLAEC
jgi:hypothetical protein